MIGSLEGLILDCPDPRSLARFYSELLGFTIVQYDDDRAEIIPESGGRPLIAFQRVDGYGAPTWPSQVTPQQSHIDVKVEDLDAGEKAVLSLGATTTGEGGDTYRVYLDPAGHPFCLIDPQD